jgi:hypothetical protein
MGIENGKDNSLLDEALALREPFDVLEADVWAGGEYLGLDLVCEGLELCGGKEGQRLDESLGD